MKAYEEELSSVIVLFESLKETLKKHSKSQELDPDSWGYVADLKYVKKDLTEMIRFLR